MDVLKNNMVWRESGAVWIALAVVSGLLGTIFYDGLQSMAEMWFNTEEYSHAVIIPFVSLFLVWQKKDELERVPFTGSLAGLGVVAFGLCVFLLGQLSASLTVMQYAFVITLAGALLAWMGWQGFRIILMPFLFLSLMLPIPSFLYQDFSAQLQLFSSNIGVWVIRLFGISVYLEGNVIDLGSMKLQVAEACSGMRYLLGLMTIGFIAAYFFKVAFWKRAFVFFSSIPVAILMNSFRIGVIGVMVEYWGKGMAEGFLHDFEGLVISMACTAMLVAEMWLLTRIGKDSRPLREVFGLEFPAPTPSNAEVRQRELPRQFVVVVVLLAAVAVLARMLPENVESSPARKVFSEFPLEFGSWKGKEDRLEHIFIDILKFDDYLLADFVDQSGQPVNLYVAYYNSQRTGKVPHSPRTCLPGGGWNVEGITQRIIGDVLVNGQPLTVNRTVIRRGETKQLVYYWFQQRGRVMTNEYLVKLFVSWDVMTRNRSDGAMVRLVAPIGRGQSEEEVDRKLVSFAKEVSGVMPAYIPE